MEHPSASHWAKITALHIARFGELTQREIRIICALYLCRNGKNDRCYPSRRTLGILTGLPRSHLSTAIAGLERKGWVCEMPDGEFFLFAADKIPPVENACGNVEIVTESVTKIDDDPPESVTESVTSVTDSVTKSYRIGNTLNKDLNSIPNSELNRARAPAEKKTKAKRKAKPKRIATRIPDPFELTDEMIDWAKQKVPLLRLAEAHADFVEHWTNDQTKKAKAIDWNLRWQKGMRLLLKWQIRDDRQNGKEIVDPACDRCKGTGRERGAVETWPCPDCLPETNRRYWKSRGK